MWSLLTRLIPFTLLSFTAAPGQDIVVETKLRSNDGKLLCSLHDDPEAFPTKNKLAKGQAVSRIQGGLGRCVFPGIPPGTYAVAMFHDENDNNTLDTSWIGRPIEGYGASNDAKGLMGPPSFADAKFEHGTATTTMRLKTRY